MFGSVPLKTYLPDGDIDLSIFCGPDAAAALKDTWAVKLQHVLLAEQANADAPYIVGDVTVINAEVRAAPRGHGAPRAMSSAGALRRGRAVGARRPLAAAATAVPCGHCTAALCSRSARGAKRQRRGNTAAPLLLAPPLATPCRPTSALSPLYTPLPQLNRSSC